MKHPTKLPAKTSLQVEFAGKRYPAWVERWTRHVFAATGPVSTTAHVVIVIDRRPFRETHQRLFAKLSRWGYWPSVQTNRLKRGT